MEKDKLNIKRKIVVPEFFAPGEHLYEDQLGWQENDRIDAMSSVSREIFKYYIIEIGFNFAFYYVDDDTFYGIHTECIPTEVKILPQNKNEKYLGERCTYDTHDNGEVLYSFEEPDMRMWNEIRINGKSLEEVIERSLILARN